MDKRTFQDLVAWQRAMDLIPMVYAAVKQLPPEEKYALGDQLRRSSVSVAANIAEGQGRQSPKDFARHLAIAKGSLAEVHTLLLVAQRLGYLQATEMAELEEALSQVRRPLAGLLSHLRS